MGEFQKGCGKGSMFVAGGADPSNPNMGNSARVSTTPHDMAHRDNKVVGGDLRGGGHKGNTAPGGIHSIPAHYQTQNGDTGKLPDKRSLVKTSG